MKDYEKDYIVAYLLDTYKIEINSFEVDQENNMVMKFIFGLDSLKTENEIKSPVGASVESNINSLENAIKEKCNEYFLLDGEAEPLM